MRVEVSHIKDGFIGVLELKQERIPLVGDSFSYYIQPEVTYTVLARKHVFTRNENVTGTGDSHTTIIQLIVM